MRLSQKIRFGAKPGAANVTETTCHTATFPSASAWPAVVFEINSDIYQTDIRALEGDATAHAAWVRYMLHIWSGR
jgi:hypothetical protein